jgi:hypothetical protein
VITSFTTGTLVQYANCRVPLVWAVTGEAAAKVELLKGATVIYSTTVSGPKTFDDPIAYNSGTPTGVWTYTLRATNSAGGVATAELKIPAPLCVKSLTASPVNCDIQVRWSIDGPAAKTAHLWSIVVTTVDYGQNFLIYNDPALLNRDLRKYNDFSGTDLGTGSGGELTVNIGSLSFFDVHYWAEITQSTVSSGAQATYLDKRAQWPRYNEYYLVVDWAASGATGRVITPVVTTQRNCYY